ncbi:ubiquitin-associated domain-containing protein 1-like isoform X2 [Portunus trituberculatus]|uniref:ubiquitin-associated domain-containing protein 1-like isoform X2 n=1 Tax=Portunus trituberculatus TaxID=210409 RepID=UPI001E1CC997|nr:ubiquitin-associated domain-containing protein 1-like isoform X2 [Portunus trituberculatus]
MLGWLKKRARGSIQARYISCLLRRDLAQADMFVAEPVQSLLTHNLKLVVLNSEGRDYSLEVPTDMTVEQVKKMAVGHFSNPLEAVGGDDRTSADGCKTGGGGRSYRLVLVREARPLMEANSIQLEQLLDNDELLLVERREAPPANELVPESTAEAPTMAQITAVTAQLPKRNYIHDTDAGQYSDDTELRRILVTMIEASVRLISANPDSEEIFSQILDKLERRHRPHVDRNALRQLTEMGFPEAKATKALQIRRNVTEAMEWLLERGSSDEVEGDCIFGGARNAAGDTTSTSTTTGTTTTTASSSTSPSHNPVHNDVPQDPAQKVLKTFLQYRKKWFQPNPQALQELKVMGFAEEDAINALRVSGNKKEVACHVLLGSQSVMTDDQGLDRDSPIISAILSSPVIQLALPKPKTLLALMMWYDSPTHPSMWLSDPDTHPFVSQVIRIYHAEKHSLNRGRLPPPAVSSAASTDSSASNSSSSSISSSEPGVLRFMSRPGVTSGPGGGVTTTYGFSVRTSEGQPHPQFSSSLTPGQCSQIFITVRNGSGGASEQPLSWLPTSAANHRSSPSRTIPSALTPSQVARINPEEPMSHSGSPIRSSVAGRGGSEVPNGVSMNLVEQSPLYNMTVEQHPAPDVEMEDSPTDSQAMDTQ